MTSLITCFKSRSNTVAYLFLRGLNRRDWSIIYRSSVDKASELRLHYTSSVGNNNKKFRSFESKENIHKKEIGPYHGFGY